jgi:hypothetical protein
MPTDGGANQAIIARKDMSLSLSESQILNVSWKFGQHQASFLPSIGKRICRQLKRSPRPALR